MKKILSILVLLVFVITSLTGCGEAQVDVVEEQPLAAPLYVYTWDEALTTNLDYAIGSDAELKDRVEIIVLNETSYQTELEEIINNPESEKKPDIYMLNENMLEAYIEGESLLSLSDSGIDETSVAEMYGFALSRGTDSQGSIKALAYELNPKAMIYRKSLATNYLGVRDERDMQSFVKDWDTFLDTARHVKKSSEGNCSIISGEGSIDGVCSEQDFVTTALKNEQLTAGVAANTDADYRLIATDNVMAYFGDIEFINEILAKKCGGTSDGTGTFGDWSVCEGPEVNVTVPSYMCVSMECSDKDTCVLLVKKLCCESSVLEKLAKDGKIVNNTRVMSNQLNAGKGKLPVLGGNDCLSAYLSQLEKCE